MQKIQKQKLENNLRTPLKTVLKKLIIVIPALAVTVFLTGNFTLLGAISLSVFLNFLTHYLTKKVADRDEKTHRRPPPALGSRIDYRHVIEMIKGHTSTVFIISGFLAAGIRLNLLELEISVSKLHISLLDVLVYLPLALLLFILFRHSNISRKEIEEKNSDRDCKTINLILVQSIIPIVTLFEPLLIYREIIGSANPIDISMTLFLGTMVIFGTGSLALIIEMTLLCGLSRDEISEISIYTAVFHGLISPILAGIIGIIGFTVSDRYAGFLMGYTLIAVAHLIDEDLLVQNEEEKAELNDNFHIIFIDPIILFLTGGLVLYGTTGAITLLALIFVIREVAKRIPTTLRYLNSNPQKSNNRKPLYNLNLFLARYAVPLILVLLSLTLW